jgi:hypothetical protein
MWLKRKKISILLTGAIIAAYYYVVIVVPIIYDYIHQKLTCKVRDGWHSDWSHNFILVGEGTDHTTGY